ncbi:MAG: M20/M25/M40 family metallo-hydrolase [Candidatus Thorarchaeota archaeon]
MKIDVAKELATLVAYDTVNDPRAEKRPDDGCAKHINSRLEAFGFITELLESEGYFTSFGRKGQGRFKILILAHYDVVPTGDGWRTEPFTLKVDGDKAYGRGTCDNKGNIVSMLKLAESFNDFPLDCTLMLAASGDEEIGGSNGARPLMEYLQKNGLFPDYIVIADGINQVIIHRRRNILPAIIKAKEKITTIKGTSETIRFETLIFGSESRHSAYQRPGVDRHALLAASKYLDLHGYSVVRALRGAFVKSNVIPEWVELDVVHPDSTGTEYNYDAALTGLIRGLLPLASASFPTEYSDLGTVVSPNLLELEGDMWTLYCDIRSMTNDGESIDRAFAKALKDRVDVFSLKVHGGIGYVNSDPNSKLIRAAEWALQKEGISYKLMEGYGASDSRYFAGKGADLFDFGPRGDNLHGPNEWVSLVSLEENARFFHSLIEVLARDPSPIK